MMRLAQRLCFAVALCCAPLLVALADPAVQVPVRVGTHPGFGRVVFDLPARTEYHVVQQGQHVLVQFVGGMTIAAPAGVPRNVLGLSGGIGQAEIVITPGSAVRDWRLGDRVVIDVLDQDVSSSGTAPSTPRVAPAKMPTAVPAPPATPSAPPRAPTAQQTTEPAKPAPGPPAPSPPVMPAAAEPSPPASQPAEAGTDKILPSAVSLPTAPERREVVTDVAMPTSPSVLTVPFDSPVGVAAFRRGSAALVVFDRSLVVDLARLRDDPVFGSASVQTYPNATLLRVPLDAGAMLALSAEPHAWRVSPVTTPTDLRPIRVTAVDGRLTLQAAAAGAVVSIADPMTGVTLLVGTQRQPGQGIVTRRRAAEFVLPPTWQGIAVEPVADSVTLRPVRDGFVLMGGVPGLAVAPTTDADNLLANASALTRRFDFPPLPPQALLHQLARQVATAAAAPALARSALRRAAAQTMIALGLGAEAQAVLQVAAADDPHEAAAPENTALASIAALLAHRSTEADGLGDERVTGSDEIALWRALRLAQIQENLPRAAQVLAATMPLLLTYPRELRDRLLPLAAETLVAGGETGAAAALLAARADDASLAFARAMLKEGEGDEAAALAIYDRLARSTDQSLHARAAVRAVEMRLATGAIDARQAADSLDRLLYAWRGDQQEKALRERLAELKMQSGAWRAALGLRRETEMLFPDDKATIHGQLSAMFAKLLHGDAADTLPPLELVALVEENADLLPDGAEGEALQARLADRLLALDLPKRAGPLLEKLMQAAPSGVGRAVFGARLAALRLREGDAAGALSALAASAAEGLPSDLVERRMLVSAEANARRGDAERALSTLVATGTADADAARATILERANDWPAAEKALADYTAKIVPAEGAIDEGQRRALLRLATAAARAGDETMLNELRQRNAERMGAGPVADMFRLLTAEQVRGLGDLKRSGKEAALAGTLPDRLKGLQATAPQTR